MQTCTHIYICFLTLHGISMMQDQFTADQVGSKSWNLGFEGETGLGKVVPYTGSSCNRISDSSPVQTLMRKHTAHPLLLLP